MKIKNLISLLLSVLMIAGMTAVPVYADDETAEEAAANESTEAEGEEEGAGDGTIELLPEITPEGEEVMKTLPNSVSELEEAGYKPFCESYGTVLYLNKDKDSENYGDVYFVIMNDNGTSGSVLFRSAKAERIAATPDESDAEYAEKMTKLMNSYYTTRYTSPHEYVSATMKYIYENDELAMFIDELTGAAAFIEKSNGQILTTNPYDVGASTANQATKGKLLSQFVFDYVRGQNGNTYTTFDQAAKNYQINIKRIRGGVRVEYTVGRQESRILLPMMIEKERFETEILDKFVLANKAPEAGMTAEQMEDQVARDRQKLLAYYTLRDPDLYESASAKRDILLKYPILQKYKFYEFNEQSATRPKYQVEELIKEYTDYTYEDLQSDHELLEYQGNDTNPPLFKMAIEYYLDESGLKVRVPAKSISYNKSTFDITQLQILPYLGAGKQGETGYTFYPDGSGTIVRFEDIGTSTRVISSKVYGQDYAYYVSSGQNKEVMRLPAFGVKRDENYTITESRALGSEKFVNVIDVGGESVESTYDEEYTLNYGIDVLSKNDEFDPENTVSGSVTAANPDRLEDIIAKMTENGKSVPKNEAYDGRTAFLAYMEEGDSLVQISTDHGGISHNYHSTYATVYPEMSDTYALTGLSSSGDATWTQQVERGYTGNYTLRIFMLDGDDADYTGMASSLRKYLLDKGELVKNDIDDKNIPLFLENFGSIKTTQKVVGIPVTENTQLTTFEQSIKMLEELKSAGVSNINLKLTGWYNGGMEHTVPSKLKVQKAIGGEKGLAELSEYAKANNVGLYPDLEFTYVGKDKAFDGFRYKDDAVRSIDDKAASHRVYSALYQGFEKDGTLIVNAEKMLELYEKVSKKYNKFEIGGISVASMGSDLSSDNSEDNALTREEAKAAISEILSRMEEDGNSILISGGNAYTYKYADLITDLPLDSSRNIYTSEAVPFLGMVLHGLVEYTGSAINLDGDFDYSVLKCIENGASPYFILSYTDEDTDNTSELKNFTQFSKYYSIKYHIWKNDMIETYKTLNDALSDVQDCELSGHKRIADDVVRVEYSNGKTFILNYGMKDYDYEGTTVKSLGFIVENH